MASDLTCLLPRSRAGFDADDVFRFVRAQRGELLSVIQWQPSAKSDPLLRHWIGAVPADMSTDWSQSSPSCIVNSRGGLSLEVAGLIEFSAWGRWRTFCRDEDFRGSFRSAVRAVAGFLAADRAVYLPDMAAPAEATGIDAAEQMLLQAYGKPAPSIPAAYRDDTDHDLHDGCYFIDRFDDFGDAPSAARGGP
jgi:hypothetical protein